MPSMTVTITTEQWARLSAALQRYRNGEEHPGETDLQLARRWLKTRAHSEVWSHEREKQGTDNAVPDFDMEVE